MEGDQLNESLGMDAIYSVQKMGELLADGPDVEREFILFELQQLLDHCLEDTLKILMPVLCDNVAKWNIDLQLDAASRLHDVVALKLDPKLAYRIMNASFQVIQSATDITGEFAPARFDDLVGMWGGILVDSFPSMNWDDEELHAVIEDLDVHAKEEAFALRRLAALALGALAQCLDQKKVEDLILPRLMDLLGDQHVQVRGNVIESLAFVGAALPLRLTEVEIWPQVEKLLDPPEDDARIRASAMRTMSHILKEQREKEGGGKLFRDFLPPVFARMCFFARKWAAEDQRLLDEVTYLLLEVVSEVYGQFLYTLSLYSRRSFRKESYRAFAAMATCNGPLIRRNCAYNLPGVCCALGEKYAVELSGVCEYLARDTDEETRWILSAGIHKTAGLLVPKGDFERIFTAMCSLLQDENPVVRMNSIENFHELLNAFAKVRPDVAFMRRLSPVFANLGHLCDGEWRTQEKLSEQIEKSASIIPSECLVDAVLPLLKKFIERGTPPVRVAAMHATAHSFRHIRGPDNRNNAIDRYWAKHTEGTYWMRLALLEGGDAALKVFSRKRFAELFASKMMMLADDLVVNVRIRVAKLLPKLAPMCRGSPEYEAAVKRLRRDDDRDVLEAVEKNEELAAVEMEKAKEDENDDSLKYQNEQEFYGLAPRQQKKVRRLGSIRSGRLLSKLGNTDDSSRDLKQAARASPRESADTTKSSADKASFEVTTKSSTGSARPTVMPSTNSTTSSGGKNMIERSFSNLRMTVSRTRSRATESVDSDEQFLARSKSWSGIIRKKLRGDAAERLNEKRNVSQHAEVFAKEEFPFKSSNKRKSRRRSRRRFSRSPKFDKDEQILFEGNTRIPSEEEEMSSPIKKPVPVVHSIDDEEDQEPRSPILLGANKRTSATLAETDAEGTNGIAGLHSTVNGHSEMAKEEGVKVGTERKEFSQSFDEHADGKSFKSLRSLIQGLRNVGSTSRRQPVLQDAESLVTMEVTEKSEDNVEPKSRQKLESALNSAPRKLDDYLASSYDGRNDGADGIDARRVQSLPAKEDLDKELLDKDIVSRRPQDLFSGSFPSIGDAYENPSSKFGSAYLDLNGGMNLNTNNVIAAIDPPESMKSPFTSVANGEAQDLRPEVASGRQPTLEKSAESPLTFSVTTANYVAPRDDGPITLPASVLSSHRREEPDSGPKSATGVQFSREGASLNPNITSNGRGTQEGGESAESGEGWKIDENGIVTNVTNVRYEDLRSENYYENPLLSGGSNGYIKIPGQTMMTTDDETLPTFKGIAPWARRGGNKIRVPVHSSADSSNSFSESFAVHGFSKSDQGAGRKPRTTATSVQSTQSTKSAAPIPQRMKAGASGFLRFFRRKKSGSRTPGK